MKIAAIIPARYGSTRLPGKPLLDIGGTPIIQHVYLRASTARRVSQVIVATDDQRILNAVENFGGQVVLTSPKHQSGTDRIAEVAESLDADLVVNVQGDEPLIDPRMIDQAVEPLMADESIPMGTVANRIDSLNDLQDPNVVKVVVDRKGFALYFSRSPIPFLRDASLDETTIKRHHFLRHIGLYVYRRGFLLEFARMEPTPLEKLEKLEQLRALENGYRIAVVKTKFSSVGVDTPEDLEKVRRLVEQEGLTPFDKVIG